MHCSKKKGNATKTKQFLLNKKIFAIQIFYDFFTISETSHTNKEIKQNTYHSKY